MKYYDVHTTLVLPPEIVEALKAGIGTPDQFGVSQVELLENGKGLVLCVLDAPDAQAVRDHHAHLGVPCGDVHEHKEV